MALFSVLFFFSSRRRHTRCGRDWSSDVCSSDLRTATDGCGVVCFGVPLRNMAWAYARLGSGVWGEVPGGASRGDGANRRVPLPTPHAAVVQSMLRHPELIAGDGRPCTDLMRAHPGRVIAKVGAEGVYCALLLREGWGVALKVADGSGPAAALAIAAVLEELGLRPRPASLVSRPNVNTRGETVGELRVNGGLER